MRKHFITLCTALALCLGAGQAAYAAPAPESFGELPKIRDAAISPNGNEIAKIENYKGQYVVHITNMATKETGKPRVIGLGKQIKPVFLKWVNDERVIVSLVQSEVFEDSSYSIGRKVTSGTRNLPFTVGYLYTLDTKKMEGNILVRSKRVFRQFNNVVVDWLEDDPDHILMSFDELSNNDRPAIRKVNVATGKSEVIQPGLASVTRWHTDTRGEPRVGQGRKDTKDGKWVMRIRDAQDDNWLTADDYPGLDADAVLHGFTGNHNELIISDYRGKDTLGLYVYDLSAKSITRKIYHNDKFDVSGVIRNHDGNEIIGARYTADSAETELLGTYNTALQRMRNKFPNYTIDFVDRSEKKGIVIFKASSPNDPGFMMMTKAGEDKLTSLGAIYSGLDAADLGGVISMNYTARDGQEIPAYVTLPPMVKRRSEIKNLPFIVLPHGGPYGRDSKRFDYFAQFFATRGYGVLQMNFRGSKGYGKKFEDAGRNNWIVMQQDVEDGARWLYEKGYADQNRTCIAGWSYGGYAALMGVSTDPDLYQCAIAMAALTDIDNAKRDLKKYRGGKKAAGEFFGEGLEDKKVRFANSPVNVADNIKVPVFLAHGEFDQNVQFDQYTRMKRALKKSKSKTTFMEFKSEDHFLSNQENRQKFFQGLDKFLTEVNGPSEFMK